MTLETAVSLPGTGVAEMRTVSVAFRVTKRWRPTAISDSAAKGSPCEPVVMIITSSAGRSIASLILITRSSGMWENPQVPPDRHVALHGPADEAQVTTGGQAGVRQLLHAMQVAGETGADDPTRGLPDDGEDGRLEGLLGGHESGRSALVESDSRRRNAPVPEPSEGGKVGAAPVDRRRVQLEVPGMEDETLGRIEHDPAPLGHRMGKTGINWKPERPRRWTHWPSGVGRKSFSTPNSSTRPAAMASDNSVPKTGTGSSERK